jgi:hypothetical protein
VQTGKISVIYQQNIAKISVNYRQFIRGFVLVSYRAKNREGYYETSENIRSVAGGYTNVLPCGRWDIVILETNNI